VTKFDGTGANDSYETNRRLNTGDITSGSNGGGTVSYPNSYIRLKRVGSRISMYYSNSGTNWNALGTTDFGDATVSTDGPLADVMYVGPTLGIENSNIIGQGGTVDQEGAFAARFRNYADAAQKPAGKQTYSIGLNFGANESGAALSAKDVAGLDAVAQPNWNNIFGNDTTIIPAGPIVADKTGASTATPVTVDVAGSGNTWSSQGLPNNENNNLLPGEDEVLLTGYLDTGNATTTQVTINNLPTDLTSKGYDVVVYTLAGVPGRGGGYRITDTSGTVLADYVKAQGPTNPSGFVEAVTNSDPTVYSAGNYIVFKNLKAAGIIVEASTENGLGFSGTPRAPINAIQLVPTGLLGGTSTGSPTISITRSSATTLSITYTGTLQSASTVDGPYTDVASATSPQTITVPAGAGMQFWRTRQ
jgi:hypothetical protein